MSPDLTPGIKLSAEDHAFHSREVVRLRELAAAHLIDSATLLHRSDFPASEPRL